MLSTFVKCIIPRKLARRKDTFEKFCNIYQAAKAELYEERRKEANRLMANLAFRLRIFKRDENRCKECGSGDGLTIEERHKRRLESTNIMPCL